MAKYAQRLAGLSDRALLYKLRMVRAAEKDGISRTAKVFATTRATVRKWRSRFQEFGRAGLVEKSRAAHRNANELPLHIQHALCALKRARPDIGSRTVVREHPGLCFRSTINRIWNRHGLGKRRTRRVHAR